MITIRDIHKRLKLLPESTAIGPNYRVYLEKAESAIASHNPTRIMKMLETGINDSNNSILLNTMLELYDALYVYGNEHNVKVYGNMIAEDYVAKVRDAKDTQTNIRRKLGRIKTSAVTKVNSNMQDITDAIMKAINGAKGNFSGNIGTVKSNIKNGLGMESKASKAKNEAFINGYEKMLESATKMIYCDRILDNYNRISKRFNIDKIIQENIYANGIDDTIGYICRLIETYDVPDKVKYNTALETVWYGFTKNYVDCPTSHYTTLITDYYLAKGGNSEMCAKLLEASMIVNKDDYKGDLEVITEEEPEEEDEIPKLESMAIQDQIRAHVVGYSGNAMIQLKEETNFNKIFNDFKKSDEPNKETKLKWLVRKLYSKNPNDIINETPTFFNYIRIVFVLGTLAINPIIAAVAAIADVFISLHVKRTEAEAMMKCYKNEIEASKRKLKNSNDPEEKARLKKYIAELEKGYEKIEEYYESKLTDAEIEKRYDEESDAQDSFKDIVADDDDNSGNDDFDDFDDFDFGDMDFNESFIVAMSSLVERYDAIKQKEFTKEIISEMVHTTPNIYNELVDISLNYPNIIDPNILSCVIEEHCQEEKSKSAQLSEGSMYSFTRSLISNAKSKMEYGTKNINTPSTLMEHARSLKDTVEILEALNEMKTACDYYHPLIEGSFTNSIKLASEKVKRTLTKMSDKERQISKNIDVAANNTKKAMEKAMTSDNREAVIKGSVLPSASKTIKLGIASAGLLLIDPVIAVIGALGYIGVSKRYKAKERQMIIDEIEIELKMCEKYIEIAESKNDMQALKKLLTIQRELERQRQRIKYNMKVKFGQKYYDSKTAPTSTTVSDD